MDNKYFSIILCAICTFFMSLGLAQTNETDFNPKLALPDFTIYTVEDSAEFRGNNLSTQGLVLVKYFSPSCDHCQEEAQKYYKNRARLSNIKTIWISGVWASLSSIQEFANEYHLKDLNPIAIGKEMHLNLMEHYRMKGLPFSAVYKDNQLIKEYHLQPIDIEELVQINDGTFNPDPNAQVLDFEEDKTIPNVTLATAPDSVIYENSKLSNEELIVFKFFSPDCNMCQKEAATLHSIKDNLKNMKIVWIATSDASLDKISSFEVKHKLQELNTLAVGKDTRDSLLIRFEIPGVPHTIVFKDNQIVKRYSGEMHGLDYQELMKINTGYLNPHRRLY